MKKRFLALCLALCITAGLLGGCCVLVPNQNATAVTIGEHTLSTAEFNYYYTDMINELSMDWLSLYTLQSEGFDPSVALNRQSYHGDEKRTWADYFVDKAIEEAAGVLALCDAAAASGYVLTDEDRQSIEDDLKSMETQAPLYGYKNVSRYLQAFYGSGASVNSYRAYLEKITLAQSYYDHYTQSLVYSADDMAAYEQQHGSYSSFSYVYFMVDPEHFIDHGWDVEDHDHTQEELDEALAKAKKAAEAIAAFGVSNEWQLDDAIRRFYDSTGNSCSSSVSDYPYSAINPSIAQWLAEKQRKPGDVDVVPYYTLDEAGNPTDRVESYYVVMFLDENRHEDQLVSVRHILIGFEGGTTNEDGWETVYSETERQAAVDQVEQLRDQWLADGGTEESFGELAKEYTDDSNGDEGGLYKDIYPDWAVEAFNDWCFDPQRKPGDHGIVVTEYGAHLIYFVELQDTTYREYLITTDMRAEDTNEWYTALQNAYFQKARAVDVSGVNRSIVISSSFTSGSVIVPGSSVVVTPEYVEGGTVVLPTIAIVGDDYIVDLEILPPVYTETTP